MFQLLLYQKKTMRNYQNYEGKHLKDQYKYIKRNKYKIIPNKTFDKND